MFSLIISLLLSLVGHRGLPSCFADSWWDPDRWEDPQWRLLWAAHLPHAEENQRHDRQEQRTVWNQSSGKWMEPARGINQLLIGCGVSGGDLPVDMSFPPLLLSLLKHLLLDGTPPTSSVQSAAVLSSFASCYFLFPVMPVWLCLYIYVYECVCMFTGLAFVYTQRF